MNEDNIKKQIAGIFNRAAPTYDQVGFRFFQYFGEQLVDLIDIPKKGNVLDVASGRGAILFPAQKKVGSQGSVIGIDLSEDMVRLTTQEINKRGFLNIKMTQMDAEKLKFPDSMFDVVFCGLSIFFFPQYQKAINESYRVLKPNGKIGVSTFCKSTYDSTIWIYDLIRKYLPVNMEKEKQEEEIEEPGFETVEGMHRILSKAGYKDIYNKINERKFVCKTAEEFWEGLWSTARREELERISPENLVKFKEELTSNFHKKRNKNGLDWNIKVLFTFGRK
ncbi:MAG: class I SAM-dependent methyltransferase [Candidatus Thorarchaeota archaeon]